MTCSELEVTTAVEQDDELTEEVRRLEASYHEELLELDREESSPGMSLIAPRSLRGPPPLLE